MSARKLPGLAAGREVKSTDARRVAALVVALESIASGMPGKVGDIAGRVFGWNTERVFLAIEAAIKRGLIRPGAAPADVAIAANDSREEDARAIATMRLRAAEARVCQLAATVQWTEFQKAIEEWRLAHSSLIGSREGGGT